MLAVAAVVCFIASFVLHAVHAGDDHWWNQDGIMILGLLFVAAHLAYVWFYPRRPGT